MTKPLRIFPSVITEDLQQIYDYHRLHSPPKADRIVAEYDRAIALLEFNPLLFREREGGWRIYPFDSGTYLLYYRELPSMWLVTGLFHASRSPTWLREILTTRP